MISQNDQNVLNFLEDFHIATSGQVCRLFFPGKYRYCMKRLKALREEGFIRRVHSTIDNSYAYYVGKKPVQVHHDLIRAELFASINEHYKIITWDNEEPVKHIRPDAVALILDRGITFPVFVEIHLNNHFDFDKYKELVRTADLRSIFGTNPRILICTDREVKLPVSAIKFKLVGLDMSGLDTLLK